MRKNIKDYMSVDYGRVHNVGAGGVCKKSVVSNLVGGSKRHKQCIERLDRAIGIRP